MVGEITLCCSDSLAACDRSPHVGIIVLAVLFADCRRNGEVSDAPVTTAPVSPIPFAVVTPGGCCDSLASADEKFSPRRFAVSFTVQCHEPAPVALHAALTALSSEQRTRCVRGVVRMMATEQSSEDYWRLAQIRRDDDARGATVAECFSALRAEDVVVRAHTGGPQTYYRLEQPHGSLIAAVERHDDRLDEEHRSQLDSLDPTFGTVTG